MTAHSFLRESDVGRFVSVFFLGALLGMFLVLTLTAGPGVPPAAPELTPQEFRELARAMGDHTQATAPINASLATLLPAGVALGLALALLVRGRRALGAGGRA